MCRSPRCGPYQVDVEAQAAKGTRPSRYPDILRRHHVSGVVVAQYVVDTSGHAVMRTMRMLQRPHPLISFAVYEWLAQMRFTPATIAGRKVGAFVQEPFAFSFR